SDKRITHDEMVLTPSLGLLTNQINRLLEQVNTNVMRRERAEDDLRKNLASLDYIVAERTEALRDSNKRLQTLVTTMESRIEQTETVAQLRLDFLTIMGHEIKTNLTGLSTLLASEIDNLQNNHHTHNLQVVHNSEHFLLQMIDDILDLSRLDASKLKLKHRQFDLGELIEQVTSLHHAEARLKGVELYSAIPANFPCVFIGDDARIRQILNTLTLNILTFSDHGELCLSVEQRDEQTVVIRIQDSGISIAADAFNAIFKPISSDLDLGTGVTLNDWGLTLVNRLLSLMNATAELKHDTSCYELAITIPLREFRHEFDDELSLDKLNDLHITVISTAPSSGTRILLRYLNGWSTHVHHIQKVPVSDYSPEEINRIINSDFCIVDQLNSITALNDQLHALSITQRTRYLLLAEAQHFPSTDTIQALNITSVLPLPLHRRPLLTTLLLHTHASPATPEQSTAQTSTAQAAVSQPVTQAVTQADTMENPLAWIHQEKELHVLLVEDNPISAMLYNTLLRNMHCRILNAQNGMEALELIPSGPFDIIFMDCHMPEMDGYEATALIRESLSEEKLPIIALTADTSHQNRNHCRQAGMNDLLQKPSSQAELASMLDTWIWHRHDKIQHGYPVTDRHPT
ncbi:MAG: response regulator, partial [Gammaproteobacteria bacterium]